MSALSQYPARRIVWATRYAPLAGEPEPAYYAVELECGHRARIYGIEPCPREWFCVQCGESDEQKGQP